MKHLRLQTWRMTALLALLVAWLAPVGAWADDPVEIDGIYYILDASNQTAQVSRNKNNTSIKYKGNINIPSTVSKDGVTYTVTSMELRAFVNCGELTGVTIPSTMTSIDYPLFEGCESLTSIVVAADNSAYDSRGRCNAIIRKSDNALVAGCKNTVIPNDVKELLYASLAFKSLTSIDIPSSVTRLQPAVFANSGLRSIVIPATLINIFDNPFRGCEDLASIVVDENNPRYTSRGCNGIFTKGGEVIVTTPATVIPDDITGIGSWAFAYRNDLTSFNVPEQVERVSDRAFLECRNLQSVTIGDLVDKIEMDAFYFCSQLQEVRIGSGIQIIEDGAFSNCYNLNEIHIGATTVPQISSQTFSYISENATVYVPAEALTDYQNAPYWRALNIVGEAGGSGNVAITSTFVAIQSIGNSTTEYNGVLLASESRGAQSNQDTRDWYVNVSSYPNTEAYPTSYDGDPCIYMNFGNSPAADPTPSLELYSQFPITGKVKNVVLNCSGSVQLLALSVLGAAGKTYFADNNNQAGLHDITVDCTGLELNCEQLRILVQFYNMTNPFFIKSVTVNMVGEGGEQADTFTFNGASAVEPGGGGTTKYADLYTQEGKTWWGVYWDAPNDPFVFTTVDGETCIGIGMYPGNGNANDAMIEASQFSGKITQVIVRATGLLNGINCDILTLASQDGNNQYWDYKESGYVDISEQQAYSWNDYTISFAGNEYTDAKLRLTFAGLTPVFVHSVKVVHETGQAGPQLSGTTGDLTWEATKVGQAPVYENGNYVTKDTYRITLSGNGASGDYDASYNYATNSYDLTTPWAKLGLVAEVVVNEGVTYLGGNLFSHQDELTSVSLPSTLRIIGYDAFYADYALEQVELPEGLQTISNYAFGACTGLKSIHIPATVTRLFAQSFQGARPQQITVAAGNSTFYSPEGSLCIIKKADNELVFGASGAVIPSTVTSIGDYAFYNAYIPTTMVIPNSVITIGKYAFYYCSSMKEMELPASVTTIADKAFAYCNALTKFTIGSGVTSIGADMFLTTKRNGANASVLADVYCYANPNTLTWADYKKADFFMAEKATKFHVSAAYLQAWQTLFPDINATYVGDLEGSTPINGLYYAFDDATHEATVIADPSGAKYTGAVEIPATVMKADGNVYTVTAIGDKAFQDCTELTSVKIGDNVETIGSRAFQTCYKMAQVTWNNKVKTIGDHAFNATKITGDVTLPATVEVIGPMAFYDSEWITGLHLGAKVRIIGYWAFGRLYDLATITVDDANTHYASPNDCNAILARNYVTNELDTLVAGSNGTKAVPYGVKYICAEAFSLRQNLNVSLPATIEEIENYAFSNARINDLYITTTQLPRTAADAFEEGGMTRYNNLHVLPDLVNTFKTTAPWSLFQNVLVIETVEPRSAEEPLPTVEDLAQENLEDAVIEGVYYNLDTTAGSGVDTEDPDGACIVIGETTNMDEISDPTPGIPEMAEKFKGIAILLQAGKGTLSIAVKTVGTNELAVKIGDGEEQTFSKSSKGTVNVPYNVTEPTYAYIYAVSGAAGARVRRAANGDSGVRIYDINVTTSDILMGDVNGTGTVDVTDVTAVISKILGKNPQPFNEAAADVKADGIIDVSDVTAIINIILGKK